MIWRPHDPTRLVNFCRLFMKKPIFLLFLFLHLFTSFLLDSLCLLVSFDASLTMCWWTIPDQLQIFWTSIHGSCTSELQLKLNCRPKGNCKIKFGLARSTVGRPLTSPSKPQFTFNCNSLAHDPAPKLH